jgi:peptide/nickel transport system substrate-binding protein
LATALASMPVRRSILFLDQTLWAEGHSLPLYQNVDVLAARVDLANYGAFGLADIDYTSIGFTN